MCNINPLPSFDHVMSFIKTRPNLSNKVIHCVTTHMIQWPFVICIYFLTEVYFDREKGRLYKIRFRFLPYEMYREEYCVTPSKILQYMETRFFKDRLMKGIEAKMRAMSKTT